MKILLTGASGFIGSRLQEIWKNPDELVPISLRHGDGIMASINWTEIKAVIHLGGLAHQTGSIPEKEYFQANENLTRQIAKAAKENGVNTFIFLSSIKVFGNTISRINGAEIPKPDDPYGQSKLNAELALHELSDPNFQIAILRPPLVLGPGAKGNLASLMKLLRKPFPLPLGGIQNQRSMLSLDGLIAVINDLTMHPKSGVFHLSNDAISTTELAAKIRMNIGFKSPLLFRFPNIIRKILYRIKPDLYQRLFADLVVENSRTGLEINHLLDEAIALMVREFKQRK